MTTRIRLLTTSLLLGFASSGAMADDIEGKIESINLDRQTFVVQGITFYVTDRTDFDDGLEGFVDLAAGIRVEVDFEYRDGKHYATEIEPDD